MKKTKTDPAILPAPLRKGDTIGLVMPAGPLTSEEGFPEGIALLHEQGYRVKYDTRETNCKNYLAGTDRQRATSFNTIWQDPEVKAILSVRGGYGSMRMLPRIDLESIHRTPKIFIGFSDICVLLNTFASRAGVVCYHGPMLTTLTRSDNASLDSFFQILKQPDPQKIPAKGLTILTAGTARGTLLGGNLTTLSHLISTPYEINWQDTILFLEDVGEAPYRVDRMLTQLHLAGKLPKTAGILLGGFTESSGAQLADLESIWQRVVELTEGSVPVWANFPSGHGPTNLTLPVGMEVLMDPERGALITCR